MAAYHATTLFLQAEHPGYLILQTNFIVGVLGSVIAPAWNAALEKVGLNPKATERVTEATMRAAVLSFDTTLSVRQSAKDALVLDAAGLSEHPSQRDRPPATRRGAGGSVL